MDLSVDGAPLLDDGETPTAGPRAHPPASPGEEKGCTNTAKGVLSVTAAVVCMMAVANFQFAWPFLQGPIKSKTSSSKIVVHSVYTVFVLMETFILPFNGYIVDKTGPRWTVMAASVLCAVGWCVVGFTSNIYVVFVFYGLAGIGVGMIYGTCMSVGAKWFPAYRGAIVGIIAAGYGAGTVLTLGFLQKNLDGKWLTEDLSSDDRFMYTMIFWGVGQGLIAFICGVLMSYPPMKQNVVVDADSDEKLEVDHDASSSQRVEVDMHPCKVLATPQFHLMYLVFFLMASTGTIAMSHIKDLAEDAGINHVQFSWLKSIGINEEVDVLAVKFERVFFGISKPLFGIISDVFGREATMIVTFLAQGIMTTAWIFTYEKPFVFAFCTGLAFIGYGEIFSLLPSLSVDLYGRKFAALNYGMLYTAKGVATIVGPLGAKIHKSTGSFAILLWYAVGAAFVSSILMCVLLPMNKLTYKLRRDKLLKHSTSKSAGFSKEHNLENLELIRSSDI